MLDQMINRFPGISCAYVDVNGKVITEYYGYADKDKNILVDENTVFPACSMSKFVTAICLMRMYEEKLIDIDAPLNNYFKQWKLLTIDENESTATIRTIMSHTAGIVDGDDSFYGLRPDSPEISLMDILEGKTFYNNRPVREEKTVGTTFEYSDAGYCALQLLVQDVTNKSFEDVVQEKVFDSLNLERTIYASKGNYWPCPDLAGAGVWSTPKEMLKIAQEFITAFKGRSAFLQEKSAKEMAKPVEKFPWTGLGVFVNGEDVLMTQGWGETGQCMMKMNCRTEQVSIVMTNSNPDMDQSESGVEWLVDKNLL